MSKKIILLSLVYTIALSFPAIASTFVQVDLSGNGGGTFNVWTEMEHLDVDHFYGQGTGSLDGWQDVRVGESAQWASDGADIDRYGAFSGGGELSTFSEHNSKAQWYPAHSEQLAWIQSDDTGWLGQNTHWDTWGGVKDVDQWKKQRVMEMDATATSTYEMGFAGHDLRHSGVAGEPDTGSWSYSFSAEGAGAEGGDGHLFVDNAYARGEHGSGQYYQPDDYNADWFFTWSGDLTQSTAARGERGITFNEHIDTVANEIWGDVIAW